MAQHNNNLSGTDGLILSPDRKQFLPQTAVFDMAVYFENRQGIVNYVKLSSRIIIIWV
jgi:hypothetical protein